MIRACALLSILAACDGGSTATPCDVDDDCPAGQFCRAGLGCDLECRADDDCPGQRCDSARGRCVGGEIDAGMSDAGPLDCTVPDGDGDGHDARGCGGDDCDDADPDAYPENTEVCDAEHDEDCDADTYGDRDSDGDGSVDAECCNGDNCGPDCDDSRAEVHGDEAESCDGLDNDCDGVVDDGVLETFYRDADGDMFGVPGETTMACTAPDGFAGVSTDCDDASGSRNPGLAETCDGIDNDCDATPDDGVTRAYYRDGDGDGYGVTSDMVMGCGAAPYSAMAGGDCDDANNARFPGQAEMCNDVDDNCNDAVDEALASTWYRDCDGDMRGDNGDPGTADCNPAPCNGRPAVAVQGDCDDTRADRYVGLAETCDGVDNDCSSVADDLPSVPAAYQCVNGTPNRGCSDGACGGAGGTQSCQSCRWVSAITGVIGECVRDGGRACSPGSTGSACMTTGAAGRDGVRPTCTTFQSCDGFCRFGACPAPAQESSCDYTDNDCDGSVDDGLGRCCYRGWSWNGSPGLCCGGFDVLVGSATAVSDFSTYWYPVLVDGPGAAGGAFLNQPVQYAGVMQYILGMTVNTIGGFSPGDGYAAVINDVVNVDGGAGSGLGIPNGTGLAFAHDYWNRQLRITRMDGTARTNLAVVGCGHIFGDVNMTVSIIGSAVSVGLSRTPGGTDLCYASADTGAFFSRVYGDPMRFGVTAGTGGAAMHVELSSASLRRSPFFGSAGTCDVGTYCDACP